MTTLRIQVKQTRYGYIDVEVDKEFAEELKTRPKRSIYSAIQKLGKKALEDNTEPHWFENDAADSQGVHVENSYMEVPGYDPDRNTLIEYLYRDASNYKKYNSCIVKGSVPFDDKNKIWESLFEGEAFIPEQVGLPADRLDEYERNEDDTCLLELLGMTETDLPASVDLTMEKLVENFEEAADNWDFLRYA